MKLREKLKDTWFESPSSLKARVPQMTKEEMDEKMNRTGELLGKLENLKVPNKVQSILTFGVADRLKAQHAIVSKHYDIVYVYPMV